MKILLLFLLTLVANCFPAQTTTTDSIGPNESIDKAYYASGKLKSERHDKGSVYFWMGEGNASIVGYYKKNGEFVETKKIVHPYERYIFITNYYESGSVKSRQTHCTDTNMIEKIIDTTWYESGHIKSADEYVSRKYLVTNDQGAASISLSSISITYYESGFCESKQISKKGDKTDTLYYESGKIKSASYTKKNKDFTKTEFREDGTISKKSSGLKGNVVTVEYDEQGNAIDAPK